MCCLTLLAVSATSRPGPMGNTPVAPSILATGSLSSDLGLISSLA